MNIPLINLKKQYDTIKEKADKEVCSVLESANYIMGKNVELFEEEFSNFIDVKHSISVANGTDALIIALKALNIGSRDEVITTPFTFFASAEAIAAVGATPVFVDVRIDTFNIDTNKIEEKITERTRAIMPVHIFGQSADMDEINLLAKKYNLFVIEDACQAVGAKYKNRNIGTLGDIACFSFFPTKNLGCAGDGGMIVTNNDNLSTICKALRAHGSGENGQRAYNILNNTIDIINEDSNSDNTIYNPLKYYNYLVGFNSRLDELQAVLLRIKLPILNEWNNLRRDHANYYNDKLRDTSVVTPYENKDVKHVYHMYILQSDKRERITAKLKECGISIGIYYPVPLHLQKAFSYLGYKLGDMPNAEYLSDRTFAVPMFAELTKKEKDYVIEIIREFDADYGK